jgi:hypothetical protein
MDGTAGPAALALLALVVAAGPATAQQDDDPAVWVSAFAAGSLREGLTGFRVARDVVGGSVRLTALRDGALQPWLQADAFRRPDLECVEDLPCNDDGWLARVGATVSLSAENDRPGLQPHLLGGMGAGFSEETEFSYLLGFGVGWLVSPRLTPLLEFRWERIPGLRNVFMLNGGIRIGLF